MVAKFTALTYELPVEHVLSLSAGISQELRYSGVHWH